MAAKTCIGPKCGKPAERGDLCWGHLKQRQRGQELRPIEEPSPEGRTLEAGNDWLEAESDAEYRATRAKFLRAAEQWLQSLGWRPPLARGAGRGRVTVAQLGLGLEVRAPRRARR